MNLIKKIKLLGFACLVSFGQLFFTAVAEESPRAHSHEEEHHHHHSEIGEQDTHVVEPESDLKEHGSIVDPVTGKPARREYAHTYEDVTYHFHNRQSMEEFERSPEKYIPRIEKVRIKASDKGFSPHRIVVQEGDIVWLSAEALGTAHGVYLEKYGVNLTMEKGETARAQFVADKAGSFQIQCSVYCGAGHHQMEAKLIVEPK